MECLCIIFFLFFCYCLKLTLAIISIQNFERNAKRKIKWLILSIANVAKQKTNSRNFYWNQKYKWQTCYGKCIKMRSFHFHEIFFFEHFTHLIFFWFFSLFFFFFLVFMHMYLPAYSLLYPIMFMYTIICLYGAQNRKSFLIFIARWSWKTETGRREKNRNIKAW